MLLFITMAFGSEPQPLTCCDTPEVQQTLQQYLKLHAAVTGRGKTPTGVLYAWAPKATRAAAELDGLEGVALGRIAALVESLKTGDSAAIKDRFAEFSRLVIPLVLRHPGGDLEVFEAHCNDVPWLQRGREVQSPYGDCGALGPPQ